MGDLVCKFGGSSVADAKRIREVAEIVQSDERRRYIVVSAPGKRNTNDRKITDLLYLCHELAEQEMEISEPFQLITERFIETTRELGITNEMPELLGEIKEKIIGGASREYVVSRGEYLSARLISEFIGANFVDAANNVIIREDGMPDEKTYELLASALSGNGRFVVPGFYGTDIHGHIRTFPRGGSDISGAITARAIHAEVYENWTDVTGFLMADPKIVDDPRPIRELTYREVRELAYMGARVFHEEAIFPLYSAGIPVNIRSTRDPEDPGTLVSTRRAPDDAAIAGIAGRSGFTLILIEKMLMNKVIGFGRRLFEILESKGISFEHAPSGIDTMSVIISDNQLVDKTEMVLEEIKSVLKPDRVEIQQGLSLISTVGEGMSHHVGIAAKLFAALAETGVNVRVIDQGSSEINITVGVETEELSRAVRAIYDAFQ